MAAPEVALGLVERFGRNYGEYHSARYNETQLRREFLDPFFKALGWDVDNEQGYAEAYKDVIHEDAVRVGGATKAPDYGFRIGGARKFFVEAKKPFVNLKEDASPAFQVRRYAWSAKLPLSILTDFEEFVVYDTRVRPVKDDKASTARLLYITYEQYAERWEEIAGVFSRQAVLRGDFDKYVESKKAKRGTAEVDAAFLAEIEGWREALARNIALRNQGITVREVNFAVQRTIDRLIFLRISEDRGIEPYGRLRDLQESDSIYAQLCGIFRQADDRYNSGLFHFREERGRGGSPDRITQDLAIDDKVIKDILKNLYYPESPYEFSVLPADLLGQVYEQFLGKVIRLTAGGRAKVEEKPEVKKAGGVYYTPTYIVDYIVENTVGKLLEGVTPRQAERLRILDPACGSGTFLLQAYQYLLDWHLEIYLQDPEKHAKGRPPRVFEDQRGEWRLTIEERKRILLNNLYGVDIDSQAVEVTKLSLLLKVLEGENQAQLQMFQERVLPDLGSNVKCGNSLIGPDFYEGAQMGMFDVEERLRINVFDWGAEFGEIMAGGGFDAVIGNPPWLMAGYYVKDPLKHLKEKYQTAKGKFDLYYLFIERGWELVSNEGVFGMIVPNKFFHTKAASNLRSFLVEKKLVKGIVDFGDEKIFSKATNYSCILFLDNLSDSNPMYSEALAGLKFVTEFEVPWAVFPENIWHFEKEETRILFEKLESVGRPLEQLTKRFGSGVQSGADRIYVVSKDTANINKYGKSVLRPFIKGRDVRRYKLSSEFKLIIFPYKVQEKKFEILSEEEFQSYSNVFSHLQENKNKLSGRVWFGKNPTELSGKWYGLVYLDSYEAFSTPHILTPALSNQSNFMIGTGDLFATGTAGVTSIILKQGLKENMLYILGILNSALISFYAIRHSPVFSGGYYKFSSPYLKHLPIRTIDFDDPADVEQHERMVSLVEMMLELHKQLASARTDHEKIALQRQIEAVDGQIDGVVYGLYGLTEEEVEIINE